MAKQKKTPKDEMRLELEGKVYVVDVKDGKTTKTELDGKLVLNTVLRALEKGMKGL